VKILAGDTAPGKWVRAVGSDMAVGETVLTTGATVSP
jgi:molybdopterin biosynthesis enzyme